MNLLVIALFLAGAFFDEKHAPALESGPLRNLPPGWTYSEDLCVHAACGTYKHARSGAVVYYSAEETKSISATRCQAPANSRRFAGKISGHLYSGFELADARASEIADIARHAPDLLPRLNDPSVVVDLAPPGASSLVICVDAGKRLWRFSTDFSDRKQAHRVRTFVLNKSRSANVVGKAQTPN
jgi:hypothetical protein